MLVAFLLLLTIVAAFTAIRLVGLNASGGSWQGLILGLALSGFIYLYGAWIYLTAYAKYGFGIIVVLSALLSTIVRRQQKAPTAHKYLYPTFTLLLLILIVLYYTGTTGSSRYAELQFPLKGGKYFVLQGGKGLPANVFHFNSRRAVYAMDLVKLDSWGCRCTKIFSKELKDYYIFGDTVYSPCDGIIQRAVSDNPDNIPPHRERGPHNLNGVVVEGNEYVVFLGHMQQEEVFVATGDKVVAGQPLGLAGNSGMSIEPHLHIQVHEKGSDDAWYRQPQLFILFGGKSYLLFEEIDASQLSNR